MSLSVALRLEREINRKYPGAVQRLERLVCSSCPTGLQDLDCILPGGGLPRGRLTEIVGGSGSGKMSLVLYLLARFTRLSDAIYIDGVGDFLPRAAIAAGVNLERLYVVEAEEGREAWTAVRALARKGAPPFLVVNCGKRTEVLGRGLLAQLAAQVDRSAAVALLVTAHFGACRALVGCTGRSLVPLRLEVTRRRLGSGCCHASSADFLVIRILKNRLGPSGAAVALPLERPGDSCALFFSATAS